MSKTETNVNNLKINRGTYANIQANLSSIGENELIITTDKNIPIPTSNDAGKVVKIDNSGEFALVADYTSENAASGGTTLSLVTTGEKYVWNNKQDAIVFNTTYNASSNKAATMADIPTYAIESFTITSWSSVSNVSPFDYGCTITATATIGANTLVELINDQPVLFATYGFSIASISGQVITIYSIGEPSSNVTLKIKIGG